MRDPVLKAGAIVGCLVALWTLLTLGPPERGDAAIARARAEFQRARNAGDNVRAAAKRLDLALVQEDFFDHNKWQHVGRLLAEEGDPLAALERFGEAVPQEVADRLAAEGFAAYYLGYYLMVERLEGDGGGDASRAAATAEQVWERGFEAFERLNREPSPDLQGWDVLYEARTLMRLERDEAARRVLLGMDMPALHSEDNRRRSQATAAVARTMAEVGLAERAAPLLDSVVGSGARRGPARNAIGWINEADRWARTGEPNAALAVYDAVARYALREREAIAADPFLAPRLFERLADGFSRAGRESSAGRMLATAAEFARSNAERSGTLGAWMDVARQAFEAGERASAEGAVLKGLREGGVGVAP